MAVKYADTQSNTVDKSWVVAVKSCWPNLGHQGFSDEAMKHYLADPVHFRAAFAVYSQLSDEGLRSIVAKPVADAPPPDPTTLVNSRSPILTRSQALASDNPHDSGDNSTPPPDALCSIQAGIPVGFR